MYYGTCICIRNKLKRKVILFLFIFFVLRVIYIIHITYIGIPMLLLYLYKLQPLRLLFK